MRSERLAASLGLLAVLTGFRCPGPAPVAAPSAATTGATTSTGGAGGAVTTSVGEGGAVGSVGGMGGVGGNVSPPPLTCEDIDVAVGACLDPNLLEECVPLSGDPDYAVAQTCCDLGYHFCRDQCTALALLTPEEMTEPSLVTAAMSHEVQCSTPSSICEVRAGSAFQVAPCRADTSLEAIVDTVNGLVQDEFFFFAPADGSVLDRSELAPLTPFSTNILLPAADVIAGSEVVQAWYKETIPLDCQGCSTVLQRAILYYPTRGVVVVYDSTLANN